MQIYNIYVNPEQGNLILKFRSGTPNVDAINITLVAPDGVTRPLVDRLFFGHSTQSPAKNEFIISTADLKNWHKHYLLLQFYHGCNNLPPSPVEKYKSWVEVYHPEGTLIGSIESTGLFGVHSVYQADYALRIRHP
jgi:hypothetical protein